MRDMRGFLTLDRAALCRRATYRHSSSGKNQCLSGAIPFSWRKDFSARSYGPDDLRIKELLERIDQEKTTEIIFALPADVEGESTTNFIVDLLKNKPVNLTRIARGIPCGRRPRIGG